MQVYDQGNCFGGVLIQPGGTAEGRLIVQGDDKKQQTRRVKVWIKTAGCE